MLFILRILNKKLFRNCFAYKVLNSTNGKKLKLFIFISLIYTKHLGELMELLGDDGVKHLDLIFEQMLKDHDEIKLALIS